MKLSKWNSYINLDDRSGLIYNSLTDSFLVVKDMNLFNLAAEGMCNDFPAEFTERLSKSGALISDDKDEAAELDNIIDSIDNDDSTLQIIINPTLDCNFHCWYCYENHIRGSKMSEETISATKLYIEKQINGNPALKHVSLSFFGGEPLLEFNNVVIPIIEATKELCEPNSIGQHVHFTTNAGMFTDEMIARLQPYKPSFQITLDGGRESHNNTRFFKGKKPSFDLILDNIFKLVNADMEIVLRINYTHQNIESTNDVIERINQLSTEKRHLVRIDFQQVWQDIKNDTPETETEQTLREFRKTLRDAEFNVTYSRLFNYVRNSCYADKRNEILINYNGDVFACTARDFKPENRMGVLAEDGTVKWENDSANKRMNCRFKKRICRSCRIAPICGGGCRTKCLEQAHHEQCNLHFNNEKIDNLILERFEQYFMK